jgi:hypothetical protein
MASFWLKLGTRPTMDDVSVSSCDDAETIQSTMRDLAAPMRRTETFSEILDCYLRHDKNICFALPWYPHCTPLFGFGFTR